VFLEVGYDFAFRSLGWLAMPGFRPAWLSLDSLDLNMNAAILHAAKHKRDFPSRSGSKSGSVGRSVSGSRTGSKAASRSGSRGGSKYKSASTKTRKKKAIKPGGGGWDID
jgi:hypothetical protein